MLTANCRAWKQLFKYCTDILKDGRTRAMVKDEMEDVLEVPRSLSADKPDIASISVVAVGGEAWRGELDRALQDVGKIAKSRLATLGVE